MARIPEIIRRNPLSQVAPQAPRAGQGWAALADLAKIGADFVEPAAKDAARRKGEKSVYRDEQGNLKVDERSLYSGEMGALQNQAAYAKYLSQQQIDLNATMSELAVKYEFDPAGFQEASKAYAKTLRNDPNIPDVLKEDVARSVEEGAARQFNGLHRKQIDRTYKAADTQSATARDMLMDDYVSLYVEGDEEAAAAKWAEIEELSRMRANAPYIAETPAETEAMMRGARGTAKAARLLRDLADLEGADEISDEHRAEIEEILKDPDISPGTRQKLYAATQGRLKSIDAAGIVKSLTDDSFEAKSRRSAGVVPHGTKIEFQMGPKRPYKPNDPVLNVIGSTAEQVFGKGARVVVTSGQEGDKHQHGSNRHKTGNAADIAIYRPDGSKVRATDEDMAAFAQTAARNGALGIGFGAEYMGGEHIHVDLVKPGAGQSHFWGSGAKGMGNVILTEINRRGSLTEKQRADNQSALSEAGFPISDRNEFLALTFGAKGAVSMLSADDPTVAADIPDRVLAANPELEGMTVREVQNWAARKMTMKSSDLARVSVQIDQIEDPEVRRLASQSLTERIKVRRNIEDAEASVFEERIASGDVSLTEQEIRENHDLSTDDQISLISALDKVNKEADNLRSIVTRINNPDASFDPADTKDRNAIDTAFTAEIGDQAPMSEKGVAAAAKVTKQTGIIPPKVASAIKSAVQSADPAEVGQALETLSVLRELAGGSLASVPGAKGLENLLSDYRFWGGYGNMTEAGQKIIDKRENPPKNVTDQAKRAAKNLKISDITDRFDRSWFSDPKMGDNRAGADAAPLITAVQENVFMADYTRLFLDAFAEVGTFELAKNRALDQMDRIVGVDEISGVGRVMKFPPQKVYDAVDLSHKWMQEQLVEQVSEYLYPDMEDKVYKGPGAAPLTIKAPRLKASQIVLDSDAITAREGVIRNKASYKVYVFRDGNVDLLPQRFYFDRTEAAAAHKREFEIANARKKAAQDVRDERKETQRELTSGILERFGD